MMDDFIKSALRRIGIHSSDNVFHSLIDIQNAIIGLSKDELLQHTRDVLILLKYLPKSLLNDPGKKSLELFNQATQTFRYDSLKKSILIKINLPRLDTGKLLRTFLCELFDGHGCVSDDVLMLDYVVIPGDSRIIKYDGIKLCLKRVDDEVYELEILGCNGIIILVFYFERMIEIILDDIALEERIAEEMDPHEAVSDESLVLSSNSSETSHSKDCTNCSLMQAALSIENVSSANFTIGISVCKALCYDTLDALGIFTDALLAHVQSIPFSKNNVKIIEKNLVSFADKILETMEDGGFQFYLRALVSLDKLDRDGKDKSITLLNCVAGYLSGRSDKHFINKGLVKSAVSSLTRFMHGTSNFLALQAVIETLIVFHNHDIQIQNLIPEESFFVIDSIQRLPPYEKTVEYHVALSNITRRIIRDLLKESSIEIYELIGENFLNDIVPSATDLYLYYQKAEHCFCHLVFFKNGQLYLEKIRPESLKVNEIDFVLQTDHWTFNLNESMMMKILNRINYSPDLMVVEDTVPSLELKTDLSGQSQQSVSKSPLSSSSVLDILPLDVQETVASLKLKTDSSGQSEQSVSKSSPSSSSGSDMITPSSKVMRMETNPIESDEDRALPVGDSTDESYIENAVEKEYCSSSKIAMLDAEMETTSVLTINDELGTRCDDSDDENKLVKSEGVTEECMKNTVIVSSFTISKDIIKDYWKQNRSFSRERTGKDWPLMYGSPCAVVIRYEHVRGINSRKRNVLFGKLTGNCTICNAKHTYEMSNNPFNENVGADGRVEYTAIKDLEIRVSVAGSFYLKNGNPDLKNPVHLIENCKGLDLRGEERRLLGMKASMEGATSVYREGMAYAQKHQIECHNRTSIPSLPVVK